MTIIASPQRVCSDHAWSSDRVTAYTRGFGRASRTRGVRPPRCEEQAPAPAALATTSVGPRRDHRLHDAAGVLAIARASTHSPEAEATVQNDGEQGVVDLELLCR